MANNSLLSIVITSYTTERSKDVFDLLRSIKNQSYQNIETILIIEKSIELYTSVKKYVNASKINNVHVRLTSHESGACFSRNLGIKEAKGEIVAFVDDDVVLFPNWAEELVKTYAQDESIVGVTGPIFPLWANGAMAWFPEEFDWIFGCNRWMGVVNTIKVSAVSGANASFRKESLDLAGNYCTALGPLNGYASFGEETELSLRVKRKTGKVILYNPQVRVRHKVSREKFKLSFIIQRSFQVGRTRRLLKKSYSVTDERSDLLVTEYALLQRISLLLPQILIGFFRSPSIALQKILIISSCLLSIVLGYYAPSFGLINPR